MTMVTAGANDAPTADAGTNQTVADGSLRSTEAEERGSDLLVEPDLGNDGL